MVHVETLTKLPLPRFASIMGIGPLHFAGVQLDGSAGSPNLQRVACQTAWPQFEWQEADRCSREEVARAIAKAESLIETHLRRRLLPTWEIDEWHRAATVHRPELVTLGYRNQRGYALTVAADWGDWLMGGQRAIVAIQIGAPITYTDSDLDGYAETATLIVASAVASCEVRLYHPGHGGDPAWEIRPITVVAAGGNLVITLRREALAIPLELEALEWGALLGTDNANFETAADVMREYNDPSSSVLLMWEELGADCTPGTTVGQFTTQPGVAHLRSAPARSLLAYEPATYDPITGNYIRDPLTLNRQPDVVRLWYLAGHQDLSLACPRRDMDPRWARTVAAFAASMLERSPCDCSLRWFENWQEDLAFSGGADQTGTYTLSPGDLDNPFGTRRGAVQAWRRVNDAGARSTYGTVLA
jgi:hypothetical protein